MASFNITDIYYGLSFNIIRYNQWRFYVGARGHTGTAPPPPKKILPRPPKFLDTVVLLLVELIGSIVNFA